MSDIFTDTGQIRLLPKTQGQDANISGRLCEENLINAFKHRGVSAFPYLGNQVEDLFLEKVLRTNVPYRNIAGGQSRSELVYYHGSKGLVVRIECRAQQTPGSVDEKLAYLFLCAKEVKEPAVWLVLGGHGARPRMVNWLRREAHAYKAKTIRVYTEDEARAAVKGLVENGVADVIYRLKTARHSWLT